jgi:hypothetical protein
MNPLEVHLIRPGIARARPPQLPRVVVQIHYERLSATTEWGVTQVGVLSQGALSLDVLGKIPLDSILARALELEAKAALR